MGGISNGRRFGAVLGALALGLVGAVGAATSAAADDFGNIDAGKAGSIVIHKHLHQSGTSAEGTPDGTAGVPSDPVAGVVFTAYPISTIDLTTAEGWDDVAALDGAVPATACAGPNLPGHTLGGGEVSPATNSSGQTAISFAAGDAVGAYLVCETSAPSIVVDRAQPFVVTIPFPYHRTVGGVEREGWLYDVHVYPKNSIAAVSKSVTEQASLGLGATASFPVTTDIPKIADNARFSHYWVQDPMDTRLTGATVSSVTVGGTAVPSSHYTVSTSPANLVTVEFTQAGLTWLEAQAPAQLVTTFTGTVATLGNGVIDNQAFFSAGTVVADEPPADPEDAPTDPSSPNYPGKPDYPGTGSAEVTQNWGDVRLSKIDAGDSLTVLDGAVFEVYAAADPYADTCTIARASTTPITVGTGTQFTSVAGVVHIPGLFVSDSVNSSAETTRCYVLREVTAPAGYVTPLDDAALTAVSVTIGATTAYDATIENTRQEGIVLPVTGSEGTVVMSLVGGALVAAGLGVSLVSRKRRRQTV